MRSQLPPRLTLARLTSASRLDRYIASQLLVALIAVTGGLVALIWLTQSLRFVELVVNRGLSLKVFLELTGLLIPNFVLVILPITTFVVVQFIYQRLAGDRELTVMRAAGLSTWALARPALAVAAVSTTVAFGLSLVVVPASNTAFRTFQFEIRNRVAAFLLQDGVFTPVSDDLTVYVRTRDPDGTLRGILVDDARQKNAHATILAASGRLLPTAGAPQVVLFDGSRQELDARTGRLDVLTFDRNSISLSANAHEDAQRFRDATEMSLGELFNPPPGLVSDRDRPRLLVEGNKRLSAPLEVLTFTLVALVAGLLGPFQRYGNFIRPMVAVVVVVGLLAVGLALTNLAGRVPSLMPLLWVQPLLPAAVAAWLLLHEAEARPVAAPTLTAGTAR